jgi:hypothetical protein
VLPDTGTIVTACGASSTPCCHALHCIPPTCPLMPAYTGTSMSGAAGCAAGIAWPGGNCCAGRKAEEGSKGPLKVPVLAGALGAAGDSAGSSIGADEGPASSRGVVADTAGTAGQLSWWYGTRSCVCSLLYRSSCSRVCGTLGRRQNAGHSVPWLSGHVLQAGPWPAASPAHSRQHHSARHAQLRVFRRRPAVGLACPAAVLGSQGCPASWPVWLQRRCRHWFGQRAGIEAETGRAVQEVTHAVGGWLGALCCQRQLPCDLPQSPVCHCLDPRAACAVVWRQPCANPTAQLLRTRQLLLPMASVQRAAAADVLGSQQLQLGPSHQRRGYQTTDPAQNCSPCTPGLHTEQMGFGCSCPGAPAAFAGRCSPAMLVMCTGGPEDRETAWVISTGSIGGRLSQAVTQARASRSAAQGQAAAKIGSKAAGPMQRCTFCSPRQQWRVWEEELLADRAAPAFQRALAASAASLLLQPRSVAHPWGPGSLRSADRCYVRLSTGAWRF